MFFIKPNMRQIRRIITLALSVLLFLFLFLPNHQVLAQSTQLELTPITWNVIGLDSNDVNSGPNRFPVGAEVCNTSGMVLNNVDVDLVFDNTVSSSPYINASPGSLTTLNFATLDVGECVDAYFEVQVTRDANAYNTAQGFYIEASVGAEVDTTTQPTELYVEQLISQNRNATNNVLFAVSGDPLVSVPAGGEFTLLVGETYDIQLQGSTAIQGYEQLESFLTLSNTIFQINSVSTDYSSNTSGNVSTTDHPQLWADACRWENDPNSPNYRSCLQSSLKSGGSVTNTYTVTIISGGGTQQTLNSLLYDFSGSSYHYNSDFSTEARFANIVDPTLVGISKQFIPDTIGTGGTSTLVITIDNPNTGPVSGLNFTDPLPGDVVVANPTNASTAGCGSPTFNPNPSDTSLSFSGGSVAASSSCTISVSVTATNVQANLNTTNNLFVGTIDTGNFAQDTLTVTNNPPDPACTPNLPIVTWDFEGGTTAPTFQDPDVTTANIAFSPASATPAHTMSVTTNPQIDADNGSTNVLTGSGWVVFNGATPTATTQSYYEITVDTSTFNTQPVTLTFDVNPDSGWANPNNNEIYVWASVDGGAFQNVLTNTGVPRGAWSLDLAATPALAGDTVTFRINAKGRSNGDVYADLLLDNIELTGCGIPEYPTLEKLYSPDPIGIGGVSTLTFTLTNPNTTVALTGAAFTDDLPSGMTVASPTNAATTCGGTWAPSIGATSLTFSGGTIPINSTCTVQVDVTSSTVGPATNISGFISTTETGTNNTSTGSASDTLTVVDSPLIDKVFNPNPILTGGISTLTFTITNPNLNDGIAGVAFIDNFPSGVVVAGTPNATNTCGGTFTTVAAATSVNLTGGSIAADASCTLTVDVTAATQGSYVNTTSAVTHLVNGTPFGTDTTTNTLVVNPPNPAIGILKQAGLSSTGPWFDYLSVAVGTPVFYQITIENQGDVALDNVVVSDPLFDGTNLNNAPYSCAFSTSLPVADAFDDDHIDTCVISGGAAVSGTTVNTATVNADYSGSPITASDDTATAATGELSIVKLATPATYTLAGEVIAYQYTVTNSGAAILSSPVTVADDIVNAVPDDVTCPALSTTGNNDNFFDPGEVLICTASYTITSADVTAGSVTNIASASAPTSSAPGSPVITSPTDTETVTIVGSDLQIAKDNDVSDGPIGLDSSFNWILTVTNTGVTDAVFADTTVILTDTLPSGPTYLPPSIGNVTNITNSGSIICGVASNVLTCEATGADVTVGNTTGSFDVTIPVIPATSGTLTNVGSDCSVDPDSAIAENDETNNTCADNSVTVVALPTITKVFGTDPIGTGTSSIVTITVTNPDTVTTLNNVTFTDQLPVSGSGELSFGPTLSTGCSIAGTPGFTPSDNLATNDLGTFTVDALAPGETCTYQIAVVGNLEGTYTNTTSVVSSDEVTGITTASDDLTVIEVEPTITKSFSPTSVAVGGITTMTLTVTNVDDIALTNVSFSDTLPTAGNGDLTYDILVPGGTTCNTAPFNGNVSIVGLGTDLNVTGISLDASSGTNTSCTVAVTVQGNVDGTFLNTTSVVSSDQGAGTTTGSDTLTVTALPTIEKTFTDTTIYESNSTTLTFTITNNSAVTPLTNVSFTDVLPEGGGELQFTGTAGGSCTGTSATISPSDTLTVDSISLPVSSSCTVTIDVVGISGRAAPYLNLSSAVSSNEVTGTDTATAAIQVNTAEPTITKAFTTDPITAGATSTLIFTINNPDLVDLTNVSFSDALPITAAGELEYSGGVGGTCTALTGFAPGFSTTTVTNDTLNISGFTLPAGTNCTVTIDVQGNLAGTYNNITSVVSSDQGDGTVTGSDDLSVTVPPPTISKSFSPDTIGISEVTQLTLTVTNNADVPVTNISYTDQLPVTGANELEYGIIVGGDCNAADLTVMTDPTLITFSGATIPANSFCTLIWEVVGNVAGVYTNTTSILTSDVGDSPAASDVLTVVDVEPTIDKVFSPDVIGVGDTTTLTFTVTNVDSIALTNASFGDILPASAADDIEYVTGTVGGTCVAAPFGGGGLISTSIGNNDTLVVTGIALDAAGGNDTCTVTVDIIGNIAGAYDNVTGVVTTNQGNGTDTAADTLVVAALPTIEKVFTDTVVYEGNSTTLTFTVTNTDTAVDLTNVSFTDVLPNGGGELNFADPISGTCAGLTGFTPSFSTTGVGDDTLNISGFTLAADTSCTVTVTVEANEANDYLNTSSVVSSNEVTGTDTATDDIAVVTAAPTIDKAFGTDPINAGNISTLTFTVDNPESVDLTGVTFSDVLPVTALGELEFVTGTVAGTCSVLTGFSSLITTGTTTNDTLLIGGFTLGANSDCTVTVDVQGNLAGTFNNVSSVVTTDQGTGIDTATDDLTVVVPAPTITKAFGTDPIGISDLSTLTLTVTNNADIELTNVNFNDPLPNGAGELEFITSTIGGTCAALPGFNSASTNDSLAILGFTLGAGADCNVTVDVQGNVAGTYTNTTSVVRSDEVNGTTTASDDLTVEAAAPTIDKVFTPNAITAGNTSLLTITVDNPETFDLTNVSFTDTLPITGAGELEYTGLVGGTCSALSGFASSITTTTVGNDTLNVSGFTLGAGADCTVTVTVQGNLAGTFNNTTSVVSSDQGTGTDTASADLAVTVPEPLIEKQFLTDPIDEGSTTTLTLQVFNLADIPLTNVSFSDALPITAAGELEYTGVVGGTCIGLTGFNSSFSTTTVGNDTLNVSGFTLDATSNCTVTIDVIGNTGGIYNNTTSVVTSEEVDGTTTASDDLTVNASEPIIGKLFSPDTIGLGGETTLTFTITNTAGISLTNVTFSDTLPVTGSGELSFNSGATGTCLAAPFNGNDTVSTTTAANDTITVTGVTLGATGSGNETCTVSIIVNSNGSVAANSYVNVSSVVGSDQITGTTTATDTLTTFDVEPTITKAFTPATIDAGNASTLTFTIENPDSIVLNSVGFTDQLPVTADSEVEYTGTVGGTCSVLTGFTSNVTSTTGTNDTLEISGFTLGAGANCTVTIDVIGNLGGTFDNVSSVVTSNEGDGTVTATDTLTVNMPEPTIAKAFATSPIGISDTTSVTFTVTNNAAIELTGVFFSDTLPATGEIAFDVAGISAGTCTGLTGFTSDVTTTTNANDTLTVSGFTLPANSGCTATIDVIGVSAGTLTNTTSVVSSVEVDGTTTASDDITVVAAAPTIEKLFGTDPINAGNTSTLTITVDNPETYDLTNVTFSDQLPNGGGELEFVAPIGGSCTGLTGYTGAINTTVTSNDTLNISGFTIGAGANCTITVDVQGNIAGTYNNTTSTVASDQGTGTDTGTDSLTVNTPGEPTIQKSFGTNPVDVGNTSTMTLTITNTATIDINNVTFSDLLPTGGGELEFVTGTIGGTCTGLTGYAESIDTTVTSNDTLNISGFTLGAGADCTVTVDVQANAVGTFTNTTSVVTSDEIDGTTTATDDLTVNIPEPTIEKVFAPDTIGVGEESTLTITVTNNANIQITGVGFTDTLPDGGNELEFTSLGGSCAVPPTTIQFDPSEGGATPWNEVVMSNAVLDALDSCTVVINVQGNVAGVYNNETSVVTSDQVDGTTTGTDDLTVTVEEPMLEKVFAPATGVVGDTTTLTLTLTNNADIALTNAQFTDQLPVTAAGELEYTGTASGTCLAAPFNGSAAVSDTTATSDTLDMTGISLDASGGTNDSCTVIIDVLMNAIGDYTNTTSIVDSDQITGTTTASSTLSVTAEEPAIEKVFTPASVIVGNTSTLNFTIVNNAGIALTNVSFEDVLPDGSGELEYSGAASGTCLAAPYNGNAAVSTTAAANDTLTISGISLDANGDPNDSCIVTIDVLTNTTGNYTNVTSPITSDEITGTDTATATVRVGNNPPNPPPPDDDDDDDDKDDDSGSVIIIFDPAISKIGIVREGETGLLGERIDWIVTVINIGNAAGNNIVVTDTLPSELRVDSVSGNVSSSINGNTVTVNIGTLNPGDSVTFTINTTVIEGGQVENIVCLTADELVGEECATGLAIGELPETGETPIWASLLMTLIGVIIVGVVIRVVFAVRNIMLNRTTQD